MHPMLCAVCLYNCYSKGYNYRYQLKCSVRELLVSEISTLIKWAALVHFPGKCALKCVKIPGKTLRPQIPQDYLDARRFRYFVQGQNSLPNSSGFRNKKRRKIFQICWNIRSATLQYNFECKWRLSCDMTKLQVPSSKLIFRPSWADHVQTCFGCGKV